MFIILSPGDLHGWKQHLRHDQTPQLRASRGWVQGALQGGETEQGCQEGGGAAGCPGAAELTAELPQVQPGLAVLHPQPGGQGHLHLQYLRGQADTKRNAVSSDNVYMASKAIQSQHFTRQTVDENFVS